MKSKIYTKIFEVLNIYIGADEINDSNIDIVTLLRAIKRG